MTAKARISKGVPAGGEFTATAHAEPEGASLIGVPIGQPRPMTREELIITGQAVPGNPALSEAARMVHYHRKQVAEATRALDTTLLNAVIIQAAQISPGAKEMRLSTNATWSGRKETTSLTTGAGDVIRDNGSPESWAFATIEGADPDGIYSAVREISQYSDIWDTDPRCDYDPQTDEHIIYLDGRRRQEH